MTYRKRSNRKRENLKRALKQIDEETQVLNDTSLLDIDIDNKVLNRNRKMKSSAVRDNYKLKRRFK